MAREEYSTIKAWGLDKTGPKVDAELEYWKNMAEALRRRNKRKTLKIKDLEQKIEKLEDIVLP